MLIKLTEMSGKVFYLDANNIRSCSDEPKVKMKSRIAANEHKPEGPPELSHLVVTYFMTPSGLQGVEVQETALEVARMVNAARSGKNLLVD